MEIICFPFLFIDACHGIWGEGKQKHLTAPIDERGLRGRKQVGKTAERKHLEAF